MKKSDSYLHVIKLHEEFCKTTNDKNISDTDAVLFCTWLVGYLQGNKNSVVRADSVQTIIKKLIGFYRGQ